MGAQSPRNPVIEFYSAGTLHDLIAVFGVHAGPVRNLALRLHIEDVLIVEVARADERAGGSIELPENSELAHLEERLASVSVDEDVLEDLVHVLRLAGDMLEVPLQFAGVGIQREGAVGVESSTVSAADHSC